MAYPKITKIEKAQGFDKDKPFAIITFSKSKGLLQSASVNGDNLAYLYPVDVTALCNEDTPEKCFDKVKQDFFGVEDSDVNLYDFAVSEIAENDAVRAYKVKDSDLQPITIFRRASYDGRDVVLARLREQVKRQVKEGQLEEVKD